MPDSLPTDAALPSSDAPTMSPDAGNNTETLAPGADLVLGGPAPKLPGYEILGELGRGGMGVVYKARHVKLNRIVALKMILAGNYASQTDLVRFLAEAEAVAALQHPNIVQIFETGQHDGLPYFTLEYVDGGTLSDKVRENPLPAREAGALVEQVARGVQFAHDKGVVHRDLKPDNVLLTSDGAPKVADFGLAKRLQTGGGLTQTGAILGTPSYMAPEQADQKRKNVGPLADVYALGAILYRLVSGRPPFQAATPLDTLVQVVCDEAVAPSQLQSKTPKDLETICLKCLRKEPEKRYDSAAALADDLGRFLRGEPIVARPAGAMERGLMWVKRNPLVTALVTAIVVSLLLGTVISYVKYREASAQRTRAEQALKAEEEQRQVAERARDRTREALDAMTSEITGDSLTTQKEISAEQKKFLTEVLSYYKEFGGERAEDEQSRSRTVAAASRVGLIEYRLGHKAESAAAFEMARDECSALATRFPAVPEYRRRLALSHNNLGGLLADLGKHGAAEEQYRLAQAICEKLAAEFPAVPGNRQQLARSHNNLGVLLKKLGKRAEEEEQFRRALAIFKELAAESPSVPENRSELARAHNNLGILLSDLGKRAEAEEQYRQALTAQEKLAAEFPAVPEHRHDLAMSHNNLGVLLKNLGKFAEAEEQYRQALAIKEKLAAEFLAVPEYRWELARSHSSLGNLLGDLGKRAEAEEQHRQALTIREKLAAEFPAVPEYRLDLAESRNNLGVLLLDLGKHAEAEEQYRQALTIYEKLVAEFPTEQEYQVDLGGCCLNYGALVQEGRRLNESMIWFEKAIRLLTPVYDQDRRLVKAKLILRNSYRGRATAYDNLQQHAEAAKDWEKAIELSSKSQELETRTGRANSRAQTGLVTEAIAEVAELAKAGDCSADQWYNLACVYAIASGKVADKKQEYADRAMELLTKAVKSGNQDAAEMAKDTDLDALRDRADFKKLLADLGKKSPRKGDK